MKTTAGTFKTLERKFSKFVGKKYGVSCNSGTSALHLALLSLGIGKGDEVIVPDYTMAACGFAVSYTGAKLVTVGCGVNLNMDTSLLEEKITSRTKAIMTVNIYGRLCDATRIAEIADKYDIPIIEDASESHGVKASTATLTCYSFYSNKIIHGEEGGIVVTDNKELRDKMNYLKNMAFNPEHNFFHSDIGYNYRMPDSQAEMIMESLVEVKINLKRRKKIESWYDKWIPLEMRMSRRDVVWVYDIKVKDPKMVVDEIQGSRYGFKPLSSMPMWEQKTDPFTSLMSSLICYLPVSLDMTEHNVEKICRKILLLDMEKSEKRYIP